VGRVRHPVGVPLAAREGTHIECEEVKMCASLVM